MGSLRQGERGLPLGGRHQSASCGDFDGSVAIKRLDTPEYEVEYVRAELSEVARVTKHLPEGYINDSGNGVTQEFITYATPLVGELPVLGKL